MLEGKQRILKKNTLGQEDDRDNFAEFLNDILFESEV